jgi:hypothetical protein
MSNISRFAMYDDLLDYLPSFRLKAESLCPSKEEYPPGQCCVGSNIETRPYLIQHSNPNSVKKDAASPLLQKLLTEVRERIWGYVLGNCTVHIKFATSYRWEPDRRSRGRGQACYGFSGRFFYIQCEAEASEQDCYHLSKSTD